MDTVANRHICARVSFDFYIDLLKLSIVHAANLCAYKICAQISYSITVAFIEILILFSFFRNRISFNNNDCRWNCHTIIFSQLSKVQWQIIPKCCNNFMFNEIPIEYSAVGICYLHVLINITIILTAET